MTSPPQQPPQPPSPSLLHHLTTIDTSISLTLYTFTQPLIPYHLLKLLELSGDGRLFFPIILSLLLSPLPTTSPHLHPIFLNLLIGALLDLIIIGLTKHFVKRRRPVYNKHMFLSFSVDQYSFPSGHASRVSFIASLIYFYEDVLLYGSVSVFVIVWASVTSVSRVLLGRHFVFDVVVGGAIGVANAVFVFRYFNCIMFQDITTLLLDPKAFKDTIDLFVERYKHENISVIAGIEARGFIFGPPIALAIGAKFVPLRKPNKLPGEVISENYILEYGSDCIEMHVGAVKSGDRALVVDDLIATGGTLCAAMNLLERAGAKVVECACVIEVPDLKGRERLRSHGKPLYVLVESQLEPTLP